MARSRLRLLSNAARIIEIAQIFADFPFFRPKRAHTKTRGFSIAILQGKFKGSFLRFFGRNLGWATKIRGQIMANFQ